MHKCILLTLSTSLSRCFFFCERLSASMARSLHLRFSLCTTSDSHPGPGGSRTAASCQPTAQTPLTSLSRCTPGLLFTPHHSQLTLLQRLIIQSPFLKQPVQFLADLPTYTRGHFIRPCPPPKIQPPEAAPKQRPIPA